MGRLWSFRRSEVSIIATRGGLLRVELTRVRALLPVTLPNNADKPVKHVSERRYPSIRPFIYWDCS